MKRKVLTIQIGRPTAYRPEYDEQAYNLCLLGCTDKELASALGVSDVTILAWKKRYPSFLGSTIDGKAKADANVARKLYHRALGYSHKAVKIFCDKEGGTTYAPYTEHYPPDTTAASLWLRNRQPSKWRDRQEVTGADGGPIQIGKIEVVVVDPRTT